MSRSAIQGDVSEADYTGFGSAPETVSNAVSSMSNAVSSGEVVHVSDIGSPESVTAILNNVSTH